MLCAVCCVGAVTCIINAPTKCATCRMRNQSPGPQALAPAAALASSWALLSHRSYLSFFASSSSICILLLQLVLFILRLVLHSTCCSACLVCRSASICGYLASAPTPAVSSVASLAEYAKIKILPARSHALHALRALPECVSHNRAVAYTAYALCMPDDYQEARQSNWQPTPVGNKF